MTDHYATLGIDRTADKHAIVRAWRSCASNYHPDRLTPGVMENAEDFEKRRKESETKFMAAREAFNVLMDANARAAHDAKLNGQADAGLLSEDDFNAVSAANSTLKVPRGACIMCGGSGEVRVAAAGFWTRRKCPGCGG